MINMNLVPPAANVKKSGEEDEMVMAIKHISKHKYWF